MSRKSNPINKAGKRKQDVVFKLMSKDLFVKMNKANKPDFRYQYNKEKYNRLIRKPYLELCADLVEPILTPLERMEHITRLLERDKAKKDLTDFDFSRHNQYEDLDGNIH